MVWIVAQIANMPGAQKEIHFGPDLLVASYTLLSMLSLYMWHKTHYDFRTPDPKPVVKENTKKV